MAQWKGSRPYTEGYRVRIMDVLLLPCNLKLFDLSFKIKLERILSKKTSGPVEGFRTPYQKVRCSNHGCSFSMLCQMVYASPCGIGKSLLYTILCEWKAYAIIRFDLKSLILGFIIKLDRKSSKSSSGPVEGLPTLHRKVPGSNHGCSFFYVLI